jgi:tetratricopeptide (TPR) repeat protein
LYRVVSENGTQSRFEVAVRTGLTPLVGREEELGLLRRHWERVKAGAGQVVLLSGESGIGKSRLVQELKEQVGQEGATRLEFRCSPYHQNSALYLVIEHVQRLLQFERDDTPQVKLEKLAGVLARYRFPQADTVPLLAHHYTAAGHKEQAVVYGQRAGQKAIERSANIEAINHLTTALAVLSSLPDTAERTRQELALQTTLGSTLIATTGWAAPEVERAYAQALDLCRQVGEPRQLFPVLWGLWAMYIVRAECKKAHELGTQLFTLAQSMEDPAFRLQAHFALGNTLFWRGELAAARAHLEQGIALYDPQQHRSLAFLYAVDPGVFCRGYATWVLWHLGFPDQALTMGYEALTLAQDLSHSQSLALALLFASVLHLYRREGQVAQERAEALIALSGEQGFPMYLAWGTMIRGWTVAEQGQQEEGIAQMHQGWATAVNTFG